MDAASWIAITVAVIGGPITAVVAARTAKKRGPADRRKMEDDITEAVLARARAEVTAAYTAKDAADLRARNAEDRALAARAEHSECMRVVSELRARVERLEKVIKEAGLDVPNGH